MAEVRLGNNWVRDARDYFFGSGRYVISEGKLWKCDSKTLLWRSYTQEEAGRLISDFLDSNDFYRPGAHGWLPIINKTATRRELVSTIWDYPGACQVGFFHDTPPGLAVGQNWVASTPEGVFTVPLTPEHRARYALEMVFPGATEPPPLYLKALTRMFGDDKDGLKKVAAFQEFIGACRVGIVTKYERAIVMPGGGSNGKSTVIMGAVEALFHPHEVRSIVPNFLNQEYYLMELRGAAINAVTELPKERVNCTERFKQVISGEDVTGRPIREMPVTFKPSAGHIFACNNFPQLSDNSKGMWRRLLVLRCDASFAKNDGLRADIVEAFKAEAPQILLWVLEGARRLMAQGDFTLPDSHYEEERQWRGSNDRCLQFISDCTHGFGSKWTRASVAHAKYTEWHKRKGFAFQDRLDLNAFGAAMRHLDGFQAKRQSHGMVYNFEMKPIDQWRDVYLGDADGGEVTLEPEVML